MIKAFITIHTSDGGQLTYVNSTVADTLGKDGEYYGYSNEAGDQLEDQTGAGKVYGDYTTLIASVTGNTGNDVLAFPGPVNEFIEKNTRQAISASSRLVTTIFAKEVTSIEITELETGTF